MMVEILTKREMEIIKLISQGYSDKQIAKKLKLSRHTISSHTSNIYKKLRAKNRSHALWVAFSQGII